MHIDHISLDEIAGVTYKGKKGIGQIDRLFEGQMQQQAHCVIPTIARTMSRMTIQARNLEFQGGLRWFGQNF